MVQALVTFLSQMYIAVFVMLNTLEIIVRKVRVQLVYHILEAHFMRKLRPRPGARLDTLLTRSLVKSIAAWFLLDHSLILKALITQQQIARLAYLTGSMILADPLVFEK